MESLIIAIPAIIGLSSAVCKVLELGARLTKGTQDDIVVGKICVGVKKAQRFLSFFAMNPRK